MIRENRSLKEVIIESAWELFSEKGYDQTTINDIISKAGISKGSFYYYFRSKDTLLNTLSNVLDNKYKQFEIEMSRDMNRFDELIELNYRMHNYIGKKLDYRLLANLYASQLTKAEDSNLLDRNRYYFRMITRLIDEGQKRGEIVADRPVHEIARIYGLCERTLISDWCMNNGEYDLGEMSHQYMPLLFSTFRGKPEK